MHEVLVCDLVLNLLILVNIQVVLMPVELQKVLSQELKFCVGTVPQSYWNDLCQILWMWAPCIFTAVDISKYTV